MKLIDCVDITYRDGNFILQPRTKNEIDLVLLGFNGTERWIRLECIRKGNNYYSYEATVCKHDGDTWGWSWGAGGHTLISESVREMQRKIVEACQTWCSRTGMQFPGMGW